MPNYFFTETITGERPNDYGAVAIQTEGIPTRKGTFWRPVYVAGLVYPMSTPERKKIKTPEPLAPIRVSRVTRKRKQINVRNSGFIDADKGHLFGLSLGGPNVTYNIVPQWSHFQRNGEWGQMESAVKAHAEELKCKNLYLRYLVIVRYKEYINPVNSKFDLGTYKGLFFPKGFTVWMTVMRDLTTPMGTPPKCVFDSDQYQDKTDDLMLLRQLNIDDPGLVASYEDLKLNSEGNVVYATGLPNRIYANPAASAFGTTTPTISVPPIVSTPPQIDRLDNRLILNSQIQDRLPTSDKRPRKRQKEEKSNF
jgi:hypothetical protein